MKNNLGLDFKEIKPTKCAICESNCSGRKNKEGIYVHAECEKEFMREQEGDAISYE